MNRGFIGIFDYKNRELAVSDGKVMTISLFNRERVFFGTDGSRNGDALYIKQYSELKWPRTSVNKVQVCN